MHIFTGTAYERGEQHGKELAEAIRDRVGRSLSPDFNAAQRTRIAQPWLEATEDLDNDLVREMAGIAAGSGTTLAEVVLLNSFEALKLLELDDEGGCTAVGVTTNGDTVIGQNWDEIAQQSIGLAAHWHRDPDAPDVAVLASPGGLGWAGMNEYGLALVNNDLVGGPIAQTAPSQAIRRFLLKQTSSSSAVSAAMDIEHPALRSYVLADPTGALVGLEVLPHQTPAVWTDTSTALAHANHAMAPKVRALEDRQLQEAVFPSSAHREARAAALLAELTAQPPESSDHQVGLRQILRDHDQLPLSICRHPDPTEATYTAASVVLNCTTRQAEFHLGLACEPYTSETVDFNTYPALETDTEPRGRRTNYSTR
ncbi:hypothetical protein A0W34_32395 (plasmid) [Rhodococcus sp. BH4]|uniref:C45 family autoproteolytic acyltransferase/hydolase n=1 Tax=Rhodococcus sp. BH4 TaxID=1807790 RepID=UPI0009C2C81F|nr:C45 family peptidase [Rhodococcus sp. BH4]ARE38167.1 hypothetical protein A0W34_32395 [Rhodococcus sp. BH4]